MADQIVLLVKIVLKPGKRPEFLEALQTVVTVMAKEPSFVGATVLDNVENPDEIVVYETWKGTRDSWIAEEYPRPYRKPYEDALTNLIENRTVSWLMPIARAGASEA
jgi:quinol monooxygenase YgiN